MSVILPGPRVPRRSAAVEEEYFIKHKYEELHELVPRYDLAKISMTERGGREDR